MKFYLTGGAVRDELLGRELRDRDYIILNADKEQLIKMGFIPVGKDFEVYLHPDTKDEYALAFENDLHKELQRRDLTINSIAKDLETGEFNDPFNGLNDIKNKILRHTSESFDKDPVRILRVARFKAKFQEFSIHEDTFELCAKLSQHEDLFDLIVGERFLLELKKALSLSAPMIFFELLKEWGTLNLIFRELSQLQEVSWVNTMLVLEKSCGLSRDFSVRFTALVNALESNVSVVKAVCERFKVDNYTRSLSIAVYKNNLSVHNVFDLKADAILKLIIEFNGLREGRLFQDGIKCCYAAAIIKDNSLETRGYPQGDFLTKVVKELKNLSITELTKKYEGRKLGEMILQLRIDKIKECLRLFHSLNL